METDTRDNKIKYVIHFEKGHYIIVDDYLIDKNGFLIGIINGKAVMISESFAYITAIDSDKLSDMPTTILLSKQQGVVSDEESYLNTFALPMDNYMEHVEGE